MNDAAPHSDSPKKPRQRRWRIALVGVLALAGVLVGLMVAAVLWLDSKAGKFWLCATLNDILAESGVEIGTLRGQLFSDFRIDSITLSDADGAYLVANDVRLEWRAKALWDRHVDIDTLAIHDIRMTRLPQASPETQKPGAPVRLPRLPDLPVSIFVAQFSIGQILLDAPILGQAAALEASGQDLALSDKRLNGQLSTFGSKQATDAPDSITADLSYDETVQRLDLKLDMVGPPDGIIAHALNIAPQEPARLHIDGSGTFSDWAGNLDAQYGKRARYDAGILVENGRLSIEGDAAQSGLVDAPYADWLSPTISLSIVADLNDTDIIPVTVALGFAKGKILVDGKIHTENSQALDLQYHLTLDQNAGAKLLDLPMRHDGAILDGTLSGTFIAPLWTARLVIDAPQWDNAAKATQARLQLSGGFEKSAIPIESSGKISGLSFPDQPDLAAFDTVLAVDGHYDLEAASAHIANARIDAPGLSITGTGDYAFTAQTLALDLAAQITALSRLPLPTALPLDGQIEARVGLARANGADPIAIQLTMNGEAISAEQESLGLLLGETPHFESHIQFSPGSMVRILSAQISGAGLDVFAQGLADITAQDLDITYRLGFTDLSLLGLSGPTDIDGGLVLEGALSGSFDQPVLAATSDLAQLDVQGYPLLNLHLDALATDLASQPQMEIRLGADSGLGPLRIEGRAAMAKNGAIDMPLVFLALGGAEIEGALAYGADGLVRGTLAGTSGDLSKLPQSQRYGLQGDMNFTAAFSEQDGKQALRLEGDGENLTIPSASTQLVEIEAINLDATLRLTDALPYIDAQFSITDFAMGFTRLASAGITAQGDSKRLHISGEADGDWRGPLSLKGAVDWGQDADTQTISLDLDGTLFGEDIKTPAPIVAQQTGDMWQIAPFQMQISQGQISGTASYGPERIHGSLDLLSVPLELVNVAAPRLLPTGTINARLSVEQSDGPATAEMHLALLDVTPAITGFATTPPFSATIDGQLTNGLFSIKGEASAQEAMRADLSLDMPLALDLRAGSYAPKADAPLEGQLSWEGALASLFMLVTLPEHEASGTLHADLQIGGLLNNPDITGDIRLNNTRYEHLDSGFLATDITLAADLSDRRLSITRFDAKDGNGGTLKGSGWAEIDETGDFLTDINLLLNDVTVIRRVDVKAVTSADLRFQKTPEAMTASGTISPSRADVDISKSLPDDVTDIEVTEIRTSEGGGPNTLDGQEAAFEPAMPVALDFQIDAPRRIFVRGRGLDSEWEVHLKVLGDAETPLIEGTASLLKGAFDFAGRRFTLDGGQLIFTGAATIDPILDIRARETVDGLDVVLSLSGPVSSPSLSLQSTPSLPEDEILSRLLFGESVADLTPLEAVQLASALASLSGGGGLDVVGAARAGLGLDRLNIEMGDENSNGPRITGGKYLTDNVYFEVATETGTGITTGTLEWALTRNLSLRSQMSSSQDNAVSIRWSWNY
ncbi:translocation/assembly module TamB [Iodidimonas muriae]|uniref:Translocation/assembly module TamB n=1 Tax=Iodidimonas muriae TaxID=261467 RepID=A0ABQ2LD88_9PROT|nr:translocation/assembly module TamB domain-containing protein [Iodidimonas muriae]GER07219.1 translocation/assembly module TamB [Kordiimonadales bacterium JCM 17843]GGO11461.1 translocation/assembly module TamB [Iodidimonas muriae]